MLRIGNAKLRAKDVEDNAMNDPMLAIDCWQEKVADWREKTCWGLIALHQDQSRVLVVLVVLLPKIAIYP